MLIKGGQLIDGRVTDIRLADRIQEVGDSLRAAPGEDVIDADGKTVIAGLRDHHVHLRAAAAADESVFVGPSAVAGLAQLRQVLSTAMPDGQGWIRAVGYHDSVAGPLDRAVLDAVRPDIPLRIQHRSGAMWFLNSVALSAVGLPHHPDGRLLSSDPQWARAIDRQDVGLTALSRELAGYGVTGVTDATPDLEPDLRAEFLQRIHYLAPGKRILHDDDLDLDDLTNWITTTHADGHAVAIHCVTAAQLIVTLAAYRTAGVRRGDRIEHGAVIPDDAIAQIADLGVVVVTQPNFVAERGDAYLAEVDPVDLEGLWRLGSLLRAGVRVASSTDFPFGHRDPWAAMRAAVSRTTATGTALGPDEAITPLQAMLLFQGSAGHPDVPCTLEAGQPGDLCVLSGTPDDVLAGLEAGMVEMTIVGGGLIG